MAVEACLQSVYSVWVDTSGLVYLTENSNQKIRYISFSGLLQTFAGLGSGVSGSTDSGGVATSTKLTSPQAIWVWVLHCTSLIHVESGVSMQVSSPSMLALALVATPVMEPRQLLLPLEVPKESPVTHWETCTLVIRLALCAKCPTLTLSLQLLPE